MITATPYRDWLLYPAPSPRGGYFVIAARGLADRLAISVAAAANEAAALAHARHVLDRLGVVDDETLSAA